MRAFRAFQRHSVLCVAILIIVPALFLVYAKLAQRVYAASITVAPTSSERDLGGLQSALSALGGIAALAQLSGSRDSMKDEAVAILRSRAFTERFLESSGAGNEILNHRFDGNPAKRYLLYRYFDERIRSVTENRRTGLYVVSIEWIDPVLAADWANALVRQLNEEMRTRAVDEAQRNLSYLERQLPQSDQLVIREALGRLIESQVKSRMLATVTEDFAFRIVDPAVPAATEDYVYPRPAKFALGGIAIALLLVTGVVAVVSRTSSTF
jgi:uncharacterized protein involved in exopolysaccharide biosynthesis